MWVKIMWLRMSQKVARQFLRVSQKVVIKRTVMKKIQITHLVRNQIIQCLIMK
ncbi:hypothetical protein HanXRQr2_Chr10g0465331 [Helianthus annuus]|uniref:Uncharacterized protein n=1 Tax=Helianthus annuus TaxID=4232 RepID=A0A9K3I222_HELAN|nr:hypothetical protein HanXRQr2_Chr10g0465331 [Helianthus annuus]KAJ0841866.1 hypothetical protein HanPSC8_Chr14g0635251 [Helianthus annuus]